MTPNRLMCSRSAGAVNTPPTLTEPQSWQEDHVMAADQPSAMLTNDQYAWTVLIDNLFLAQGRRDAHRWCQCVCGKYRLIRKHSTSKSCGCLAHKATSLRRKQQTGSAHCGWKGGHWNRGSLSWATKIVTQGRNAARCGGYAPAAIDAQELADLFAAFSGVCPICLRRIDKTRGRKLALDHCHSTGRVRGFICHHCNACLGWSERRFDRVMAYLERNRSHVA